MTSIATETRSPQYAPSVVTDAQKQIEFIQYDIPPLRTDAYQLTVTETVPGQSPDTFAAVATFVVRGERFAIQASEIASVFPPELANGEFRGVFPHVVFNRRTLPWERVLRKEKGGKPDDAFEYHPWLAVLVLDDAFAPKPTAVTAADLVEKDAAILDLEGKPSGKGTLDSTVLSYGAATLSPLGYGESASDPCTVIDLDRPTFDKIAPSSDDLLYLAHIRKVDVSDGIDADATTAQFAVVVGNRIPVVGTPCRAFLVSLENFADYLPATDGTPSTNIPATVKQVRLLTYRTWTFTANDLDEKLEHLLEGLNTTADGNPGLTTLRLVGNGADPTAAQVTQALADQTARRSTPEEATTLAQNAVAMGYVPLNHHLRHGGKTVSWYRGPFTPYAVTPRLTVPIGGPDAANAYDAQTGMFDVSYGAAWQLGQLLALQNGGMATALYRWKLSLRQQQAVAAEQTLIDSLLKNRDVLPSFFARRRDVLEDAAPTLPSDLGKWFGGLGTLQGVPFNYLVPDERMLPPESLRFFYLDLAWIDALVDGAFSIGRCTAGDAAFEAPHAENLRALVRTTMRACRPNRLAATRGYVNPTGQITGFLLRSKAVAGWPNLRFKGYLDAPPTQEIPKLRQTNLSADTVLCLFDGVLRTLRIQEPPEALHMGVEDPGAKDNGLFRTYLRWVNGSTPGKQMDPMVPSYVNPRVDGRTMRLAEAKKALEDKLTGDPYDQVFERGFTSAEFALEMNKGVVMVEYENKASVEAQR